jgi:hypothetical protein
VETKALPNTFKELDLFGNSHGVERNIDVHGSAPVRILSCNKTNFSLFLKPGQLAKVRHGLVGKLVGMRQGQVKGMT